MISRTSHIWGILFLLYFIPSIFLYPQTPQSPSQTFLRVTQYLSPSQLIQKLFPRAFEVYPKPYLLVGTHQRLYLVMIFIVIHWATPSLLVYSKFNISED